MQPVLPIGPDYLAWTLLKPLGSSLEEPYFAMIDTDKILRNHSLIGDWNHKHKKSKTISSRVDVLKNLTEMDIGILL